MWWDDDSWVSEQVRMLSAARREGRLPATTVIGSTWTEHGDRTMFVGVDPRRDPRPWAWAAGSDVRARLIRALVRGYGPLPDPSREPWDPGRDDWPEEFHGDVIVRGATEASLGQVMASLASVRRLTVEEHARLLILELPEADAVTRDELASFDLPAMTRIGYLGPIRSRASRGSAVFRRWSAKQATVGCAIRSDRGSFITTAGHIGASVGDLVYKRKSSIFSGRKPWGRIAALTCPESPDPTATMEGVDIAAISAERPPSGWTEVKLGDPRRLHRFDYVGWNGGKTGVHTGAVTILAKDAASMEKVDYQHAVLVLGNPPSLAGAGGDSGTGMYDSSGHLLGYFVGTEGGRTSRGVAAAAWFQMIDSIHPYLENHCGPIQAYLGDGGG